MRNLYLLIVNYLRNSLGSVFAKKNKATQMRSSVMFGLLLLGAGAIFAIMCWQAETQYEMATGFERMVLFYLLISVSIYVLMIAVMKVSGVTQTAGDNDIDMLLSMPIRKHTVVIAKAVSKYLFDLLFVTILCFPNILMYFVSVDPSLWVLFAGVILVLMLSFVSLGLGFIMDFAVGRLFNKSRFASLFKSIVIMAVLVGVIVMNFSISFMIEGATPDTLDNYPPVSWMLSFVLDADILSFLFLFLITAGVLTVGTVLFALNFGRNMSGYKSRKTDIEFKGANSVFGSLFTKELGRYLNSTIYMVNTLFGPLMLIILTIMVAVQGADGVQNLLGAGATSGVVVNILTMLFCLMSGMSCISCSSISLEGSSLWVLRSSPLKENSVFMAKAVLNIVVIAPILILCAVVCGVILEIAAVDILLLVAMPVMINLIISFGGVFINLMLPKMKWQTELAVIKNSSSMLVTMMLGVLMGMLPTMLPLVAGADLSFRTIMFAALGIYAVILVGFITALFTYGKKLFRRL